MAAHLRTLLVAGALTVAIAVISGGRWPHFLMGSGFALSLWVMLLVGSAHGTMTVRPVAWATYAMAAAITLVLGFVFYKVGDGNGAWWGPAVILAGTLVWSTPRTSSAVRSGPESE